MKKMYYKPEVQVTHLALRSNLLTGSPTTPSMGLNIDSTDDQW